MKAHTGEYPVYKPYRGRLRRYEATYLGHEDDEGNLADVGAFTRHVWPGEDNQLGIASGEVGVVGHEGTRWNDPLHHGMPAAFYLYPVPTGQMGPHVAVTGGHLGEGREDIYPGNPISQGADCLGCLSYLSAHLPVKGLFKLFDAVPGIQNE